MNHDKYIILKNQQQRLISLEETKHYLRLEQSNDEDDKLLSSMLASAIIVAEEHLGVCLSIKEVEQVLHEFTGKIIDLHCRPVVELQQVAIVSGSKKNIVDKSMYHFNRSLARLELLMAATQRKLIIRYRAGYEDSELVPQPIKLGILNHVACLYDDRQLANLPRASVSLYAPYRRLRLG